MTHRICIPIRANTLSNFLKKIGEASRKADILELWLDGIEHELDWEKIFALKKTEYLLNLKTKKENGSFVGTHEKRFQIVSEGVRYGAKYVDLDYEFPELLIKKFIQEKGSTELILSVHFFQKTPDFHELLSLAYKMKNQGADIIKIATMANEEQDVDTILKLSEQLKHDDIRHISLAMGELGTSSRTQTHSEIVFAALNEKEKTAPGQITIEGLLHLRN